MPPCTLSASQFRLASDKDGNILAPMDWRGVLVRQNQVPVPRLLSATLTSPVPLLGIRIPGKSFVASYTPEGGLLPPIFEPESDAAAPDGVARLFGSADAPYTILRLARRSAVFQQCTGGSNNGLPCNEAADCPGATCGSTTCVGGARAGLACSSDGGCPGGECGPSLLDLRAVGVNGNGPVTLGRLGAGVCEADTTLTCSMDPPDCSGGGPCVRYALTAENPVPLEGLVLTPEVLTFAVNEAIDAVPRNNDGDTVDTVVTLRDRATGQGQALGAPTGCGIAASPAPQGRAVVRTQQAPFTFPAVATEGDVVAFLESEATTNDPTPPHVACDMNGDNDSLDAVLRVYKLGGGEVAPSVPQPLGDGALAVNGRALAVSQGRVYFRSPEAGNAVQSTLRASVDPTNSELVGFSELVTVGSAWTAPQLSQDGRFLVFQSNDTNVAPGANGFRNIIVRDLKLGVNEMVSIPPGGGSPNGSTFAQSISADGRYVAMATTASNLMTAAIPTCTNVLYGTTPCEQIVLRDRCVSNGVAVPSCTPSTEPISVDSLGNAANDHNEEPSVSADGRFVAFRSWATNLVTPDSGTCGSKLYASGSCPDIFVRDRCLSNGTPVAGCTPSVRRASRADNGAAANGSSELGVISGNGRYVAFESAATNLDSRDVSVSPSIYLHDLQTLTTELVSIDFLGGSVNGNANGASVSADGRFVAFFSNAGTVVPGDANGEIDEFVRDRYSATTERVSIDSNGLEHSGPGSGSGPGQLSADGRFIVFASDNDNLVPGVADGISHAYVRDRATGTTEIVDVSNALVPGNVNIGSALISGDGRMVAFETVADNLVADGNAQTDVFIRGLDLGSAAADLSGDLDADDTLLRVLDSANGTVSTLCPAGQVSVTAGAAAFLRPETAGATSNPGCSGVSLSGPDLNSDGDADDSVVHFVSAGGAVQNLGLAADAVVLSAQCSAGPKAGNPCRVDGDCPASACSPALVGALVSEAAQNSTNLNGDNDATPNDSVVHVYDLAASAWKNVGYAADAIDASGPELAFLTPEAAQNADLNGDGDKSDRVLEVYDAKSGGRTNTAQAAEEMVVGAELGECGASPLVAFRTSEAAQGNTNLNGDLNTTDYVLQVYAKGLGVINTGQAVTPCRLEACDPRLPYRVYGSKVKFLTYEVEQGQDLNGDGDATDLILQEFDACARQRKVISSIDTSNTSSGSVQDPLAQDPQSEGHAVITSSKRCMQGMTTLLVPPTCLTLSDCPSNATACSDALVVAAPGAVPTHDTVLQPLKPINVTIGAGKTEVLKTIAVKVRNADVLPVKEKSGHEIRVSVESGDCPALTVDALPDFDPKTTGEQDKVLVLGGQVKTAKVRLRLQRADFTTHNAKAPARCTLVVRASTVVLDNADPTPRNNVQRVDVNIIDKNDSAAVATHESVLRSANPIKLTIPDAGGSASKTVGVKLTNADVPPADASGHAVTLSVDQGDCPAASVSVVAPSTLTIAAGASATAKVTVTATAAAFSATSAVSPGRCTAVLTADTAVMGNVEPDATNNRTQLLIDVNDKSDY